MSYPCSRCVEDGLIKPRQVKRAKDWCARCKEKHPDGPPQESALPKLDDATIEDIADGTLRMLHATQTRLEQRMLASKGFSITDAAEAVKLAKAVAVAVDKIRILRGEEHADIDTSTPDEMRVTMIEWFKLQSRDMQHGMLREMVDFYRSNAPKERADGASGAGNAGVLQPAGAQGSPGDGTRGDGPEGEEGEAPEGE